jgi:capsular polysaccharide biosynthesis protein
MYQGLEGAVLAGGRVAVNQSVARAASHGVRHHVSGFDGRFVLLDIDGEEQRLPGAAFIGFEEKAFNYYHLLIETVPRIQMWKEQLRGKARLILPPWLLDGSSKAAGVWAALSLLGVDESEATSLPARRCRFDTVHLIEELPALAATFDLHEHLRIRHGAGGPPTRRLFVSRARARSRRLLNEEAVFASLRPLGFERVFAEDYGFAEQIALFSQAEAVCGPHGAGLTNILYMPPSAAVIEVLPDAQPRPWFWRLSAIRGLRYGCLFGEVKTTRRNDFVVDLDRFRDLTALVLENR